MTVAEPCCPECGSPRDNAGIIDCPDCGRPLGLCADSVCGYLFRLFASDDPADCDGCGEKNPGEDARLLAANGPCPGCGRPRQSPDGRCIFCSMMRMIEQHEQMRERSGPHYDLATQRGRIITAAWRAAGSPARLQRVYAGPHRIAWYLYAPWKRGHRQEATPAQVAAWQAWCAERSRLHRELGWDRSRA